MSGRSELRSKLEPLCALPKVGIEVGDISWEKELNCAIVSYFFNIWSKDSLKNADVLAPRN